MKKIIILLAIWLPWIQPATSQSVELSPTVISTAGNYSESGSISLSWTLGELAVSTLTSGDLVLTQGFQQGYLDETGLINDPIRWQIIAYPNPVKDMVRLQFDLLETTDFLVEIQDAAGRIMSQNQYKQVFPGDVIPVDMSDFDYGVYFFSISTMDRSQVRVLSITKI